MRKLKESLEDAISSRDYHHQSSYLTSTATSTMEHLSINPALPASDEEVQTMRKLKESLEDAIRSKGRQYEAVFTRSVRFEADNTGAVFDAGHFSQICEKLRIPSPEEVVLQESGLHRPMLRIATMIHQLEDATDAIDGHTLIVIHYAGHGILNEDDSLCFVANPKSRRCLMWQMDFGKLWLRRDAFQRTDVLFLLDCCYAGAVARTLPARKSRTVEVLAGCGSAQQSVSHSNDARDAAGSKTFTYRVDQAIDAKLKSYQGKRFLLGFNNLISDLRMNAPLGQDPRYFMKIGCVPILFPVGGSVPAAERATLPRVMPFAAPVLASRPQYSVMFNVTVDDFDVKNGEHQGLIDWISRTPREVGLKIHSIFKSGSYILTMEVPWDTWVILLGLPGYKFVAEITGDNLLLALESPPKQPMRQL